MCGHKIRAAQDSATGAWKTLVQASSPHALEHFQNVMVLWATEPQIVVPPILRAELEWIHDLNIEQKSTSIVTPPFPSSGSILKRRLIPRQTGLDRVLEQIVTFPSANRVEIESIFMHEFVPQDLPFYCPKIWKMAYQFNDCREMETDSQPSAVCIQVYPIPGYEDALDNPKLLEIMDKLLNRLLKFMRGSSENYQKRVHHDVVVPKIPFQNLYAELKGKYKHWTCSWLEDTDPSKHVFEDIAIATFLILLWREEEAETGRRPTFLDFGCGNGFLVHILSLEGYTGCGIDQSRRKMWDLFTESCNLREETFLPDTSADICTSFDWIIGNHPDELTLWIPILAARSQSKFIIIPCCFFELDGSKFTRCDKDMGRYETYCNHVRNFSSQCGFIPETEMLRIPSTKNACIVGRKRLPDLLASLPDQVERQIESLHFRPRVPDREKTRIRLERENRG